MLGFFLIISAGMPVKGWNSNNQMTILESYCKAVATDGKEITIDLKDKLTQALLDRVQAVADQYNIACHASTCGILLKPKIK